MYNHLETLPAIDINGVVEVVKINLSTERLLVASIALAAFGSIADSEEALNASVISLGAYVFEHLLRDPEDQVLQYLRNDPV